MGHRAYVAYRREDGLYNVHFSHWGAHDLELQHKITASTPLGGENDMEPAFLGTLTQALEEGLDDDAEVGGKMAEAQDTTNVEPDMRMAGVTVADIMDEMPFDIEAVYFAEPRDDELHVRGYHVESDMQGDSLLIAPRWWADEENNLSHDRGWISGAQDALNNLVEADVIDTDEANARFMTELLERFETGMRKTVLATSPAVRSGHMERHPEAFIRFSRRSRVMGEMYPGNIRDPDPWELPDGFPSIKTCEGERVDFGDDGSGVKTYHYPVDFDQ